MTEIAPQQYVKSIKAAKKETVQVNTELVQQFVERGEVFKKELKPKIVSWLPGVLLKPNCTPYDQYVAQENSFEKNLTKALEDGLITDKEAEKINKQAEKMNAYFDDWYKKCQQATLFISSVYSTAIAVGTSLLAAPLGPVGSAGVSAAATYAFRKYFQGASLAKAERAYRGQDADTSEIWKKANNDALREAYYSGLGSLVGGKVFNAKIFNAVKMPFLRKALPASVTSSILGAGSTVIFDKDVQTNLKDKNYKDAANKIATNSIKSGALGFITSLIPSFENSPHNEWTKSKFGKELYIRQARKLKYYTIDKLMEGLDRLHIDPTTRPTTWKDSVKVRLLYGLAPEAIMLTSKLSSRLFEKPAHSK